MPILKMSETDKGSKGRAIRAFEKIREKSDKEFKIHMDKYWKKVHKTAQLNCIAMGAYDTGTLHDSIRIRHRAMAGRFFEVSKQPDDIHITRYIVAGGERFINPKTGKPCNYAQIVHDGGLHPNGKHYFPPRPFLSNAIDECDPYLARVMGEYIDKKLKDWRGE